MKEKIAYYPTPIEIVNIMINLSKIQTNKDLDFNVFEAGFGMGAFFDEIIRIMKLRNNNSFLYGMELDTNFFNIQKLKIQKNDIQNVSITREDYLNYNFNKTFETIIGNPPYITNDTLPIEIKNKIKDLTGSGEGNIYYAFIIKSIQLLEDNGELIYILPYDFFFNTYAKQLREVMIREGEFETIIDLGDLNIFKNASPETIIFKWIKRKNKKEKKINIYKYINKGKYEEVIPFLNDILKDNKDNHFFTNFEIDNFILENKIWSLSNFIEYNTKIHLSKIANVGVGIVNGAESSYKVSNNDLNQFNEIELKDCVKTFIKAKNIDNYKINDVVNDNKYIFIDNKIKEENELIEDYPNIYKYLYKNYQVLSNRYISKNSKWFNYLAIRNKELMDNSIHEYKIIVPCLTRKEDKWFSITNLPYYISGDVLMIKGKTEDNTFLLFAILNSEYFNKFYKEKGPKKGKRTVFNQKILTEINIPLFNKTINEKLIIEVKKMLKTDNYDFSNINLIIKKELLK